MYDSCWYRIVSISVSANTQGYNIGIVSEVKKLDRDIPSLWFGCVAKVLNLWIHPNSGLQEATQCVETHSDIPLTQTQNIQHFSPSVGPNEIKCVFQRHTAKHTISTIGGERRSKRSGWNSRLYFWMLRDLSRHEAMLVIMRPIGRLETTRPFVWTLVETESLCFTFFALLSEEILQCAYSGRLIYPCLFEKICPHS